MINVYFKYFISGQKVQSSNKHQEPSLETNLDEIGVFLVSGMLLNHKILVLWPILDSYSKVIGLE